MARFFKQKNYSLVIKGLLSILAVMSLLIALSQDEPSQCQSEPVIEKLEKFKDTYNLAYLKFSEVNNLTACMLNRIDNLSFESHAPVFFEFTKPRKTIFKGVLAKCSLSDGCWSAIQEISADKNLLQITELESQIGVGLQYDWKGKYKTTSPNAELQTSSNVQNTSSAPFRTYFEGRVVNNNGEPIQITLLYTSELISQNDRSNTINISVELNSTNEELYLTTKSFNAQDTIFVLKSDSEINTSVELGPYITNANRRLFDSMEKDLKSGVDAYFDYGFQAAEKEGNRVVLDQTSSTANGLMLTQLTNSAVKGFTSKLKQEPNWSANKSIIFDIKNFGKVVGLKNDVTSPFNLEITSEKGFELGMSSLLIMTANDEELVELMLPQYIPKE